MAIGSNVKARREQRGLTQEELAKIAGVATTTISSIEVDYRLPSVKVAKKLARALRCSVDQLLKELE
ncbi:MAG: helix-turn-helix transcriptional regulator [Desulfosporosinus sp.]|jgi:DNA-binding XRE family transcriptional regulator